MDERKLERKMLRRGIGSYTWALLVYYLIMNLFVIIVDLVALIYEGFQAFANSGNLSDYMNAVSQNMEAVLYGNGWGYLLASGFAVLLIAAWKGKAFFGAMFENRRKMSAGAFFCLLCVFLSGQTLFQIFAVVIELVLNQFGLSAMEAVEMASAGADTLSMFLYMGIVAPVVEEIVFRGLIMRGLQPYGKRFAVLTSAILFGLFHGNLIQSPYAFVVGLVLGYTAMEYSILWSMVLHMVNNLVLGDILSRLTSGLPEFWPEIIMWIVFFWCTVAALVILLCKRSEIRNHVQADRMDRRCLRAFFTALPNILLMILMMLSAVSMLFV